jgi:hypothetical protein
MEIIKNIGAVMSLILGVSGVIALFVKPIREKIFGLHNINDGVKSLLRDRITQIYYKNLDICELKEYEFESVSRLYDAYKALGGNSFVDKIYREMSEEWGVSKR